MTILEKYHYKLFINPHLDEFLEPEWEEWIQSNNPDIVLFEPFTLQKT